MTFFLNKVSATQVKLRASVAKTSSVDANEFHLQRIWVVYSFGIIYLISPFKEAIQIISGALHLPREFIIPSVMM